MQPLRDTEKERMSDDITPEQMKEILESEQLDINDFLDPRPLPIDWDRK